MQLICLLFVSEILLIKKYAPINLLTHVSTILTDVDHNVIIPRFLPLIIKRMGELATDKPKIKTSRPKSSGTG